MKNTIRGMFRRRQLSNVWSRLFVCTLLSCTQSSILAQEVNYLEVTREVEVDLNDTVANALNSELLKSFRDEGGKLTLHEGEIYEAFGDNSIVFGTDIISLQDDEFESVETLSKQVSEVAQLVKNCVKLKGDSIAFDLRGAKRSKELASSAKFYVWINEGTEVRTATIENLLVADGVSKKALFRIQITGAPVWVSAGNEGLLRLYPKFDSKAYVRCVSTNNQIYYLTSDSAALYSYSPEGHIGTELSTTNFLPFSDASLTVVDFANAPIELWNNGAPSGYELEYQNGKWAKFPVLGQGGAYSWIWWTVGGIAVGLILLFSFEKGRDLVRSWSRNQKQDQADEADESDFGEKEESAATFNAQQDKGDLSSAGHREIKVSLDNLSSQVNEIRDLLEKKDTQTDLKADIARLKDEKSRVVGDFEKAQAQINSLQSQLHQQTDLQEQGSTDVSRYAVEAPILQKASNGHVQMLQVVVDIESDLAEVLGTVQELDFDSLERLIVNDIVLRYRGSLPNTLGQWRSNLRLLDKGGVALGEDLCALVRDYEDRELLVKNFNKMLFDDFWRDTLNAILICCEELRNLEKYTNSATDFAKRNQGVMSNLSQQITTDAKTLLQLDIIQPKLLTSFETLRDAKNSNADVKGIHALLSAQTGEILRIKGVGFAAQFDIDNPQPIIITQK